MRRPEQGVHEYPPFWGEIVPLSSKGRTQYPKPTPIWIGPPKSDPVPERRSITRLSARRTRSVFTRSVSTESW